MEGDKGIHPGLIGFDIDCVVADTMEAFIRLAMIDYGIKVLPEDITSFQVESCLAVPPSIIDEIFSRLLLAPVENGLKPMAHAVAVLTEMSACAPVTFITARPEREPVDRWLESNFPQDVYRNSRLVAMGKHDGKAQYVRELGLQYFVDDRVETCIELALAGISPIVFAHPWNRGRHSFASIDSWLDIKQRIFINEYVS
ncbi:MAG: hypothetical protein KKC76_17390 [Proteobacteria bacterium]|nr:hypothetical protein [Pseudomonadota bacterium]MBU4297909.1 hypothetical protein [Pseudomonadota bacterium]MCG2746029.1 hypothetical protein [Desulfobulbaceae bacterium]